MMDVCSFSSRPLEPLPRIGPGVRDGILRLTYFLSYWAQSLIKSTLHDLRLVIYHDLAGR